MNITKLLKLISRTTGPPDASRRAIAIDSQAKFSELVKRFQGPLFGFLGRMGFGQAQAEDLAQETFLRAWQSLGQYNPQRGALLRTSRKSLKQGQRTTCAYVSHRRMDRWQS